MMTVLIARHESSCLSEDCRAFLSAQEDLKVIGEVTNLSQVSRGLSTLRPDILLLDHRLLRSDKLDELAGIHRKSPGTKVLVVSNSCEVNFISEILKGSARGCLASDSRPEDYAKAIRIVHGGDFWVGRKVLAELLEGLVQKTSQPDPWAELDAGVTEREREIIQCVVQGMTNKEIAKLLGISDKTVKAHLSHIFQKLNVHRRSRLLRVET